VKILEYRKKFQICGEILQEFLSINWQYWHNVHALPTAALFCFGQFVFEVHLIVLCLCFVHSVTESPH
jgi:hypothetical protein